MMKRKILHFNIFDIQISYIFQSRRVIFQKIPTTEMASFSPLETLLCHQPTPEIVLASLIVIRRVPQAEKIPDYNQVGGVFVCVCVGGGTCKPQETPQHVTATAAQKKMVETPRC